MDPVAVNKEIWDVGARRIARVYAEALLNAAEARNQVDDILEELASLVQGVIAADPKAAAVFSSAALGRKARLEILEKVFKPRASELFYQFLRVLNDHERLDLLTLVNSEIRALSDQRRRRIRVQVSSAVPLVDDQRERISARVRDFFQLEPILLEQVEPSLLGGLRVRIGDRQLDSTVRTRLETLKQQLLARSSHEIQSGRDRFSTAVGD
jgi:F-type H+-transporting ATPase subunit delta